MKPVILTNFGYQRKGWIEPIEKIRQWVDVRYIHFYNKESETNRFTDAPIYYWADFSDAYELLDKVSPDFVLFMGLESGTAVALNFAAKKIGIPSYYLQHGLYSNYSDYRFNDKIKKANRKSIGHKNTEKLSYSNFIIQTFRKTKSYKSLLLTIIYVKLIGLLSSYVRAAKLARFNARFPDWYICYSRKNADIHFKIDGANNENVIFIGYPELDSYFRNSNVSFQSQEIYYLLIDQPLAENRFGNIITTKEKHIAFYKKMAEFSSKNGVLLKVKMHPESYNCTWLPQMSGVEYLKDVEDMSQLIKGAKGCFGFFSTLILPAIYFNYTILFEHTKHSFYDFIKEYEVCTLCNFETFDESELIFPPHKGSESTDFVKECFPFNDSTAIERVRHIFVN